MCICASTCECVYVHVSVHVCMYTRVPPPESQPHPPVKPGSCPGWGAAGSAVWGQLCGTLNGNGQQGTQVGRCPLAPDGSLPPGWHPGLTWKACRHGGRLGPTCSSRAMMGAALCVS